jgi:exo-beta-1,3-glucanase (GH17 family)
LASYIRYFRQSVPDFPVVINDTFDALMNDKNQVAIDASDAIMVNIYPYWKGIDIMEAIPYLHKSFLELKAKRPHKLIAVGETGWPSEGDAVGAAVPDPLYSAFYLCSVANWAKAEQVVAFSFEAFDEPWKADYEGNRGEHWGIWDKNGNLKPYMNYTFEGYFIPDYWSI